MNRRKKILIFTVNFGLNHGIWLFSVTPKIYFLRNGLIFKLICDMMTLLKKFG
ncbi:hypothetical protein HMPREF0495_01095 [Levilactobacillus brevis ATCC 14869 = DSM 20054]|uniref:Uncharacterized protein n=1 Tax=Levilactobacillus brevis ATCC 14869 = DSM 20054 TaxID=649758 RepID=U2PIT4_LEVBR|nr:hypothetical protein HMPREF0495_01095 [Levilactobacillus brevis ATCC 14869 = DSM 20054]